MSEPELPNVGEQRSMLRNIVVGIFVWGLLLGLGTFIFRSEYDIRKPLIVIFFTISFLLFWCWLLYRRFGRIS